MQKKTDKIQYPFMIKALKKLRKKELYLNIIKARYDKPISQHYTDYGKKLKAFLAKSGMRQGCPLTPFLYSAELARAIRQKKERKGIQIEKDDIHLSLFANSMILNLKDPKHSTRKPLDVINTFRKYQDTISI
jgi:hypothetical protein